MIEFFVRRPVTTLMFVLVFVVLGFVAFSGILVEKTPSIEFPIITITAEYPGATPLEVETLVVNKIEDAVSEISEIEKIRSYSYDNFGYVFVQFLLSADVNVKSIEVKDKVEAIVNDLPDAVEKPVIEKFDPLMEPVLELILSSDKYDGRDLYEFADKTLKNRFSSVEGVAKVDVYGGKERRINVILDPVRMKQKYISITEVINALQMKNMNVPGGILEKGLTGLSVRFVGEFQDVDEIRNMILTSTDGSVFPLSSIATVTDGFKKVKSMARYNGKDVVGLSLNKVSDGNAVKIAEEVRARMDEFRAGLPEGMELKIATDTTDFIIDETKDTEFNIIIGILLTVIILYFFTGRANLTFIAAVVIPTSLISTFSLISASGFSINIMTLMAIATCLGTLIANAIVIIENVLKHLEEHDDPVHAAISGTKEVSGAVIASTGTNLVVFTPIAMMGGIVGQFFRPFGLTVVYATLFSLLASFSLTPMLCGRFLKKRTREKKENKVVSFFRVPVLVTEKITESLKREYKRIFGAIFRRPLLTLAAVFLLFFSLSFIMPYIDNEFFPSDDEDQIKISVVMPKESTIDRTLETVSIIESRLDKVPEKDSYLTNIGENGVENATITFDLLPSAERKRTDLEIMDELIPYLAKLPDAEINISRGGMGSSDEGDISINVYGTDYNRIIELSRMMKDTMEKTGFFRSVTSSYKTPKKEIQFIPDQGKMINYNLTGSAVGAAVRASIYGNDDNVYKEKGEEYAINVELDDKYTTNFDDIKEISVLSRKGLIPITELGRLKNDLALPTIRHRDKERVIRLEGFLAKGASGYVIQVLDGKFKELPFEKGYGYRYTGDFEHQEETGREMGKAFILAIILTFMLLAAIMNSGLYPLAIMMTVLTSFIGVFPALFFAGYSINVMSMMGMIMLVGLVVNNAILLLDYALLKMKEGVPVKEALWLGASEKFRAILMTSLAIVLGVLPQMSAMMEGKRAMGAVMIGGMLASIVFTFVFIPVVFWYLERFRLFLDSLKKGG